MKLMKIRIFFFIISLMITNLSHSQQVDFPIDKNSGEIIYLEIIENTGLTKKKMFLKASEWFAKMFKTSKNVIQFSDQDSGKIIGKGNFNVTHTFFGAKSNIGYVTFMLEISIKDDKFRYKFTDLWHHNGTSAAKSPGDLRKKKSGIQITKKAWLSIRKQTHDNILNMIKSLKGTMKDTDDDW